jgi:hypothetical protein
MFARLLEDGKMDVIMGRLENAPTVPVGTLAYNAPGENVKVACHILKIKKSKVSGKSGENG